MAEKNVTYTIMGATGNIGSRIARELLNQGKKVRVIGRHANRLQPFASKGAEMFAGSADNPAFLTKAFDKSTAVFTMIPPNATAKDMRDYQKKISESMAAAIVDSGVKYIVNLSSVGAQLSSGSGPILGLHDNEKRLDKIPGVNIVHLRPASFMENLFSNIDTIRNMGIVGSPLKGNLEIPMIATKDIAAAATELLLALDFKGSTVRELLGERNISMNEVTKIFSKALGRKDVSYVQFPYADAEKAMGKMGLSPSVAGNIVEMYRSINDGTLMPTEERGSRNSTPTSIEDFAQGFAEIYGSVAKAEVTS